MKFQVRDNWGNLSFWIDNKEWFPKDKGNIILNGKKVKYKRVMRVEHVVDHDNSYEVVTYDVKVKVKVLGIKYWVSLANLYFTEYDRVDGDVSKVNILFGGFSDNVY